MSQLPLPPSFKSTIIQISPEDSENTRKRKAQRSSDAKTETKLPETSETAVAKEDAKSAAGKSKKFKKAHSKTAHSIIEKKRRTKLNREFDALKILVPACRNSILQGSDSDIDGMYKLTVLQATVEYINYLHEIIEMMGSDQETLQFAKIKLRLESYRNLDHDFKFSDLVHVFKLLSKKTDTQNETQYLLSKGVSQETVDFYRMFFDVKPDRRDQRSQSQPQPQPQMQQSPHSQPQPQQSPHSFSYANPYKQQQQQQQQHLQPGSIKYSNAFSNEWKSFGTVSPSAKSRATNSAGSAFSSFSLPSPILDLPKQKKPSASHDYYPKPGPEFFSLLPNSFEFLQTPKDKSADTEAGATLLSIKHTSPDNSPALDAKDDERSGSQLTSILN